ncbi:MAG: prepilin-type N-terminal cleavage/methylation domain-containing protein [Candidatus Omnitrophica bacterium]|nr:prepilin-type N-terminal cleavage/methylation domain-containing protein [Candidatus Omnitrophota bacterium]
MNNRSSNRGGFTVMELLIVTIIIAVIAAFAIPSYEKAMARQKVKRLILTANLIAGAQEIYKTRNSRYWCDASAACSNLGNINAALGIAIVAESGVTYTTNAVSGSETTAFQVVITDGTLFTISASSPPLNVTCTNLSATPVCP